MSDEQGVRQFTELEGEYVERRLAGCIARLTDKAAGRRVRDRAKLARRTDYWARAMECHRAGLDHDGIERIRHDYAAHMKAAVRHGLPVSETVAASEAYRKAAENRRRYEKGRHTSFANRSVAVNDSMQAKRGYKAKRQDGKTIGPEHLAEIDAIVTDFESVVGPLAELFRKTDLTVAHTNGKHPFMDNSGGLYHSNERTVSVGVAIRGKPVRAAPTSWPTGSTRRRTRRTERTAHGAPVGDRLERLRRPRAGSPPRRQPGRQPHAGHPPCVLQSNRAHRGAGPRARLAWAVLDPSLRGLRAARGTVARVRTRGQLRGGGLAGGLREQARLLDGGGLRRADARRGPGGGAEDRPAAAADAVAAPRRPGWPSGGGAAA